MTTHSTRIRRRSPGREFSVWWGGLTDFAFGWSSERYTSEAQVTVHLGPVHLHWWWFR